MPKDTYMDSRRENNKRIAKNTGVLYLRTLITIPVSLYTSRIILGILGIEDYGIYNTVATIVIFFSFINTAMSAGTQRFLNYELGRNDLPAAKRVFGMSMTIYIIFALAVVALLETVGLWFLNARLNIPAERMEAANWVYQFSILSFCIQMIRIPYEATVIAHERMSFFAYLSIADVLLKLSVALLLLVSGGDKLIVYAALNVAVVALLLFVYKAYCSHRFDIARYRWLWDVSLFRKMASFSGWTFCSAAANMGVQQGTNIFLNLFYGVALNAAMGVVSQASNAIYHFVYSFQTAFYPSIIKSYAAGNKAYFEDLLFKTSKYSYFLLFIISLPMLLCCDFVMDVWLSADRVPQYAADLCRLTLISMLIESAASPFWIAIQATGKIRGYQLLTSSLMLLNLPLMYLALWVGMSPLSVLVVRILVDVLLFFARLVYVERQLSVSVRNYLLQVVIRLLAVTLAAASLSWLVHVRWDGWPGLFVTTATSIASVSVAIYLFGLRSGERTTIIHSLQQFVKR
jgi:O-antigen/teichoic acid export membrane protein